MSSRNKRLYAMIVVLAMAAMPLLAGGAQESGQALGGAPSDNFNPVGLPIVDEPVTLSVVGNAHQRTEDWWELQVFQELEETTNVQIEWELVRTDWQERKSLILASGDLPDAFFGGGLEDSDIVTNRAFFVAMEDYISEYGPNIQAMFAGEPTTEIMATAADGSIYALPSVMPHRPAHLDWAFINTAWLDRLGLDMPTTTEEFYLVLKAFKEGDPNGNGEADEIPLQVRPDGSIAGLSSLIFGAFGVLDNVQPERLAVNDGHVEWAPVMDGYRDAVVYLRRLYEAGLLDPEMFTMDYNTFKAKNFVQPPITGVTTHWSINAGVGQTNEQYYETLLPLEGPDGTRKWRTNPAANLRFAKNRFSMTTRNEHPEVTMRWINEVYDEAVSLQLFYGAIGRGVERGSGGTYTVLEHPADFDSFGAWTWTIGLGSNGPMYVGRGLEGLTEPPRESVDKLRADEAYTPYYPEEYYPPIAFPKELNDELAIIRGDLDAYAEEKFAQWVVDGGIENEWDGYIAQLNRMGLERMMDIYQQAYDNVMSQ